MIIENVLIPKDLLIDVIKLTSLIEGLSLDERAEVLCKSIEARVWAKVDAMVRREKFTQYKTAAVGSDGREQLRHEYLNCADVGDDWRTKTEHLP